MIRAKKRFGQHFLKDENIANNIVNSLSLNGYKHVLEIGSGTGILTQFLLDLPIELLAVELDRESVAYLSKKNPELQLIEQDFLKLDLAMLFKKNCWAIIGNFPYNISTQIIFKIIENRFNVIEMVGMFQKEVAQRIVAKPGSKTYGIISVLTQAFYHTEMLFEVAPEYFIPPPKVTSALIKLTRNNVLKLDCDEQLFKKIVKTSFNQRRKTIRNSLKSIMAPETFPEKLCSLRPEALSVEQFVVLTNIASNNIA